MMNTGISVQHKAITDLREVEDIYVPLVNGAME